MKTRMEEVLLNIWDVINIGRKISKGSPSHLPLTIGRCNAVMFPAFRTAGFHTSCNSIIWTLVKEIAYGTSSHIGQLELQAPPIVIANAPIAEEWHYKTVRWNRSRLAPILVPILPYSLVFYNFVYVVHNLFLNFGCTYCVWFYFVCIVLYFLFLRGPSRVVCC